MFLQFPLETLCDPLIAITCSGGGRGRGGRGGGLERRIAKWSDWISGAVSWKHMVRTGHWLPARAVRKMKNISATFKHGNLFSVSMPDWARMKRVGEGGTQGGRGGGGGGGGGGRAGRGKHNRQGGAGGQSSQLNEQNAERKRGWCKIIRDYWHLDKYSNLSKMADLLTNSHKCHQLKRWNSCVINSNNTGASSSSDSCHSTSKTASNVHPLTAIKLISS